MQARLKVLHDKANVKQVKLLPVTLIGRSTECNLKIASSQVSRAHCRITLGEDKVFVEDLGSANGTLVNGQRLPAHQPTAVVPGATLVVGPAEFMIDYVASTSATMVLSRVSMPIGADLPSTEMLLPAGDVTVQPGAAGTSAFNSATTSTPTASPASQAAPRPLAAVAVPVAQPVLMVAPVVPVVQAAAPPISNKAPVSNPFSLGESSSEETLFAGFPPSDEPTVGDEPTQFLFSESVDGEEQNAPAVTETPAGAAPGKKGGLKSLFSLFGRKGKEAKGTAAPTPPSQGATLPNVFLPTLDPAIEEPSPAELEVAAFSFGVEENAPVDATAQTVNLDPPEATPPKSGDEEDGFHNFLKQL